MLSKITFVFCVGFSIVAQASWNLNDVTFLMPLPEQIEGNQLLRLDSPAKGGSLLPEELAFKIPPLSIQRDNAKVIASLRVVAVRVDPCFPLPVPEACQRQIRIVWQPLEIGIRARVQTVDAALHSFYVLSDDEFTSLLQKIQAWKAHYAVETDRLPLQINPAWAVEKDRSPALQDFQKIVTEFSGVANLSRVTTMVLRGAGDMWAFAGFQYVGGKLSFLPIPRINRQSQAFVNQAVPADHFANALTSPLPQGEDTFNTLMKNSDDLRAGQEDLIRNEMKAIYRIENPRHFSPENMDCVSCHVAQPARAWILKNRTDLKIEDHWNSIQYKNANHDLSNSTPDVGNTQMIRALGYFGADISISQRVIHESADVADAVTTYLQRIRSLEQ